MRGSSNRAVVACLHVSQTVPVPCQLSQRCFRLRLNQRFFHSSPNAQQKRKPRHKSLSQADLERITQERAQRFPAYTAAQKAALAKKYSKEQYAAIEAGEAAISPTDLATQSQLRRDFLAPSYMDDFSRIEPVIDKKVEKLRGEEQDYENNDLFGIIPESSPELEAMEDLALDREFIGRWKLVDGEWFYEGREQELDHFSAKEFEKTAEYKAFMSDYWQHAAGEVFTAEQLEAMRNDGGEEEKTENGKEEEEREEEEEHEEDHIEESEEGAALEIPSVTKYDIDYATHPKYREIRARREAEGPMRRRHGFGTLEPDREIQRIMEGVFPDVAPELPKMVDPSVRQEEVDEEADQVDLNKSSGLEEEALEAYQRVARATGQTVADLQKYRLKTLVSHYVTNQTDLGKISSIYTLVVAGNMNGMLGIGEGKAKEPAESLRMANLNAIKSMIPILRYEDRTIYGDVEAKVGATVVKLSARRPGFGVRTNSHIFEIAKCAGLQDLAARVPRSRNPMNMAKAVWGALRSQRHPEDIARGRGKKLVDVRKVYYSGLC